MPRLNKVMIEEIVKSVINKTDFAKQRDAILKETSTKAHAYVLSKTPPGLTELSMLHPKEWFTWQDELCVGYRDHFNMPTYTLKGERAGPQIEPVAVPASVFVTIDAGEVELIFGQLQAEAIALVEKRDQAAGELRAFLQSCRTTEKAVERMPELAPHIPTKVKSYPLAAPCSVLSTLTSLGFTAA